MYIPIMFMFAGSGLLALTIWYWVSRMRNYEEEIFSLEEILAINNRMIDRRDKLIAESKVSSLT